MNVPIFKTLSCDCWWPQAAEEIVTISVMHHSVKCACFVRSRGGWGKQEAAINLFIQPMPSILPVHWALETYIYTTFKICRDGVSPHHHTCNIFIFFWLHNIYLGGKASLNISAPFCDPHSKEGAPTAHVTVVHRWHWNSSRSPRTWQGELWGLQERQEELHSCPWSFLKESILELCNTLPSKALPIDFFCIIYGTVPREEEGRRMEKHPHTQL